MDNGGGNTNWVLKDWIFDKIHVPRLALSGSLVCLTFVVLSLLNILLLEFSLFNLFGFVKSFFVLLFGSWVVVCNILLSTACILPLFTAWNLVQCSYDSPANKANILTILQHIIANFVTDVCFCFAVLHGVNEIQAGLQHTAYYITSTASLVLSVSFFRRHANVLSFPNYIKPMLQQAIAHVEIVLFEARTFCIKLWAVSVVSYLIFGYHIMTYFYSSTESASDSTSGHLNTFTRLVGFVYFLWASFSITLILFAKRRFTEFLFNITFCKPVEFDIPAADLHTVSNLYGQENEAPNLTQAMAYEASEYLNYLAFWDFSRFTRLSKPRIRQVFIVSRPGGHPRPWNSIRDECTARLKPFLDRLTQSNDTLARRWASTIGRRGQKVDDLLAPKVFDESQAYFPASSPAPAGNKRSFFGATADSPLWQSIQEAFEHYRLYVWIIEGLGNVICSAMSEDSLGVVQRDLGALLALFCNLQANIERLGRLWGTQYLAERRRQRLEVCRLALKAQLTATLRQVNSSYEQHLKAIGLSDEHIRLISSV